MTGLLSPFMLRAHGFAVIFQSVSLAMVADLHARYPGDTSLGFLIGWIVFFGAYSTHAICRHRAAKLQQELDKAEQDKSA